jgi:hypothetical protein
MSTYSQQRVWRWIAISVAGAAVAALVRAAGRRGRDPVRLPASRSSDETAAAAALEIADGAMNDEGGPARHV